jgi:hypothetical protein
MTNPTSDESVIYWIELVSQTFASWTTLGCG